MATLTFMAKKKSADEETTTVKVSKKTAKSLLMLSTWSDLSVADYCTKTLDPLLEEWLTRLLEDRLRSGKTKRE